MDANGSRRNDDPYLRLGVRPFINCCSVRTIHGGSLMLPEVKAAMAEAAKRYVNIYELMEHAGERLSELTGAEWGVVTCGSAAAVCLAAAGSVAGNDPEKMLRMPNTEGMKNRVIIPKGQRFAYDHAIRMVGASIIEVDNVTDLETEFDGGKVAMVCVLGVNEAGSRLRLEEIVKLARPRGIPVLVDAASEHISRPDPWLTRGANMVIYSGGKFLRGPQTTGLLLGDKDIVRAAWANASPHQAFGRPMKVSKEDVIGILTAVEIWFGERDHQGEEKKWRDDLAIIAALITRNPAVTTKVIEPQDVVRVPRLVVAWDKAKIKLAGVGLRQALLEGEPRVMLDDMEATEASVQIDPFGLQPGEAKAVGTRIAEVLAAPPKAADAIKASPSKLQLAGDWEIRIKFLNGEATHHVKLGQNGQSLSGSHRTQYSESSIEGSVSGDRVELRSAHPYEGTRLSFRFEGEVRGDALAGTVTLGTSGTHAGPVNLGQFGSASWSATRAR
ncbi:MAG: aminotransferase class V-fold PLP-dependent enzyme [Proteobacteria bacterium]|nr:aminotransferase class V-fold PLP-dependent enzyme [Pseudomonadota bacterium]MBI3496632.1 aminotransferase class V-fold PLP-dependent enzyme [Pseudomonadota bacterium]